MLKHIVLYKLKEKEKKSELVEMFLSMNKKIPELKSVCSGADILDTARSFDVALICDFEDESALNAYLEHPYHQKVRAFVQSIVEKAHSVDYIF